VHELTLPTSFRGEQIRPGDGAYNAARTRIFNTAADAKPALIVRPIDVDDVAAVMRYASAHELPVAIRGGGHDLDGSGMVDSALVIDFTRMRRVTVDPAQRLARADAGVLLGELDRATCAHRLATVSGTVSNTGIAGLTLGGGIGWLMRKHGTTVDNVLAFEAVTPIGERILVDPTSHPDLFWAMRGGGGNFAVATTIVYRLHPIASPVTGGRLVYAAEDAAELIALWRGLMLDAPRELASTLIIGMLPRFPFVPKQHHDRPGVQVTVCHVGSQEQAERDLRPLLDYGNTIAGQVKPTSYLEIQSMSDAMGIHGYCAYELGGYLPPRIDDRPGERLLARAFDTPPRRSPVDGAVVMLTRMGGAVDEHPDESAAFAPEGAGWYWNAVVQWALPDQAEPMRKWARSVRDDLHEETLDRCYVNLTVDQGEDWLRRAYGERKYGRLEQLKAEWDPLNLLRYNKNVRPGNGASHGHESPGLMTAGR
jgi:FAD/FMN-containing dehydrogenase